MAGGAQERHALRRGPCVHLLVLVVVGVGSSHPDDPVTRDLHGAVLITVVRDAVGDELLRGPVIGQIDEVVLRRVGGRTSSGGHRHSDPSEGVGRGYGGYLGRRIHLVAGGVCRPELDRPAARDAGEIVTGDDHRGSAGQRAICRTEGGDGRARRSVDIGVVIRGSVRRRPVCARHFHPHHPGCMSRDHRLDACSADDLVARGIDASELDRTSTGEPREVRAVDDYSVAAGHVAGGRAQVGDGGQRQIGIGPVVDAVVASIEDRHNCGPGRMRRRHRRDLRIGIDHITGGADVSETNRVRPADGREPSRAIDLDRVTPARRAAVRRDTGHRHLGVDESVTCHMQRSASHGGDSHLHGAECMGRSHDGQLRVGIYCVAQGVHATERYRGRAAQRDESTAVYHHRRLAPGRPVFGAQGVDGGERPKVARQQTHVGLRGAGLLKPAVLP